MADAYDKARKAADKAVRQAVLKREYPYLRALDEILKESDIIRKTVVGIKEIPADLIVGTKVQGRQNMFACNFMPAADRNSEFAMKWSHLYDYQTTEGIQDPVLVYEYRHFFYVQEGNKRVSVLKYLNVPAVAADVIRVEDGGHDELYEEFLSFYRCTGLYELNFSEKGSYRRLAGELGKTTDEVWDEDSVRKLKASYYIFREAYRMRADEGMLPYCSDAFLLFLSVYGMDGIRKTDKASLSRRMVIILKEMSAGNRKKPVRLVGRPEEQKDRRVSLARMIPAGITKIAFIHDGDPSVSASVFDHELGRILVTERYRDRIHTDCYFSGDRESMEAAAASHDILFTTSPGLRNDTIRTAVKYPEKKYYNCSLYQAEGAVNTYDVRLYEVQFLLGALAAVFCRNHLLGYISEEPKTGTVSEINAFAVGAAMVDPEIKVYLAWTGDQEPQEEMRKRGIRIISGPALPSFEADNTEFGLYRLTDEGIVNLAAPVIHWEIYYEKLLNSLLKPYSGPLKGKSVSCWWGMSAGVTDLTVSQRLPYPSRKMISLLRRSLIQDTLHPFEGEIHCQDGIIQPAGAGRLSDEEIIKMDWLNDNVIGTLPKTKNQGNSGT